MRLYVTSIELRKEGLISEADYPFSTYGDLSNFVAGNSIDSAAEYYSYIHSMEKDV